MKNQKSQVYILIAIVMITFFASSCKKDDPIVKDNPIVKNDSIVKIDPIITWLNPMDITIGTLLSARQLNATATVTGTFIYTPPFDTRLSVGANQDLIVDFIPSDLSAYNVISKTVKINVIPNSIQSIVQLEMIDIPAGTFTMGSPPDEVNRDNDEAQHQVTLTAFRMSKYEITVAQYAAFLNARSIGSDGLYAAGAYPTRILVYENSSRGVYYRNGKWIFSTGKGNHPVIDVTYYGATEFANYVSGNLPTEAQWEYACRAGTTTPFNTGSFLTNLQANYNWKYPYNGGTNTATYNSHTTQAVGAYPANGWGLHDMHGNVLEWCSNWYFRGGSCDDHAHVCRSANRYNYNVFTEKILVGFRVVLVH